MLDDLIQKYFDTKTNHEFENLKFQNDFCNDSVDCGTNFFDFFDLKLNKIDDQIFEYWFELIGVNQIINKRSKTWRILTAKEKNMLENPVSAVKTIKKFPLILKRPILQVNDKEIIIGFSVDSYSEKFRKQR